MVGSPNFSKKKSYTYYCIRGFKNFVLVLLVSAACTDQYFANFHFVAEERHIMKRLKQSTKEKDDCIRDLNSPKLLQFIKSPSPLRHELTGEMDFSAESPIYAVGRAFMQNSPPGLPSETFTASTEGLAGNKNTSSLNHLIISSDIPNAMSYSNKSKPAVDILQFCASPGSPAPKSFKPRTKSIIIPKSGVDSVLNCCDISLKNLSPACDHSNVTATLHYSSSTANTPLLITKNNFLSFKDAAKLVSNALKFRLGVESTFLNNKTDSLISDDSILNDSIMDQWNLSQPNHESAYTECKQAITSLGKLEIKDVSKQVLVTTSPIHVNARTAYLHIPHTPPSTPPRSSSSSKIPAFSSSSSPKAALTENLLKKAMTVLNEFGKSDVKHATQNKSSKSIYSNGYMKPASSFVNIPENPALDILAKSNSSPSGMLPLSRTSAIPFSNVFPPPTRVSSKVPHVNIPAKEIAIPHKGSPQPDSRRRKLPCVPTPDNIPPPLPPRKHNYKCK